MLAFYCTKDATKVLQGRHQQALLPALPPAAGQVWAWQLHAVTIARRRVLVAMQVDTRFAILLWGVRQGDVTAWPKQFLARLRRHADYYAERFESLPSALLTEALDAMQAGCQPLALLDGGTSRSVQRHLNELVASARCMAQEAGVPEDDSACLDWEWQLNDTLRSIGGGTYFAPDLAWHSAWLRQYAACDETVLRRVADRHNALKKRWLSDLLAHAAEDGNVLDRLDDLMARAGEQAMSLPMLEGFFAALICAPNIIPPSVYMTSIWPEGPLYESRQHAEDTLYLLMQQWNRIAGQLQHTAAGASLEALLLDEDSPVPGGHWAAGFMTGIGLWAPGWERCFSGAGTEALLMPVLVLVDAVQQYDEQGATVQDAAELQALMAAMMRSVPAVYRLLEPQRAGAPMPKATPHHRSSPKVGRNDPCLCGSGKKYKQCCGRQGPTLH